METDKARRTIPLDYIRSLLVAQRCRCAITGLPLNPQQVNADHIVPLSRKELSPSPGQDNIWLVHKRVNAMKGTMTYAELVETCRQILAHHESTSELLAAITKGSISPVSKKVFGDWVRDNCAEDGSPKCEQTGPTDLDTADHGPSEEK